MFVVLLSLMLVGTYGCNKPQPTTKQEAEQKVKEELQKSLNKALSDPSRASQAGDKVTARYQLGQEFAVNFAISEWVSENGVTKPVPRKGKARIKVINWQMQAKAGDESPQNGAFMVVNLTITGDAANAGKRSGSIVTPRDFGAIGTESAPKFSVVDAQGQQYKYDSWHTRSFNVSTGWGSTVPRSLSDINIDETRPRTINLNFDVPQNISQPRLRVECTRLNNAKDVFEVELGAASGQ